MNLKAELEQILSKMKKAVGVYIMDADGLVVDKVETERAVNLEIAFVEFLQGFRSFSISAKELDVGPVMELSIATPHHRYLFCQINPGYFLALAMTADGYLGEGRYHLGRAVEHLAAEFTL